jgi:enoyl-CoA hydratase
LIDISEEGQVTVLTLKYGKSNAQDIEFCRGIVQVFESLRQSETRAVILTGQGSIFSAGVDLLRLTKDGPDYVQEFLPALSKMFETVFFFPKPVVAAINGHAIAGGCVLACCADYRVMTRDKGRIGVPELLVGVPFPAVALEVMRFATSPQYFTELLNTGATVNPETALRYGLINAVAEADELMEQALKIASQMATLPPKAFALTKAQVHAPAFAFLRDNGEGVDEEVIKQWSSPPTLEAIQTYIYRTFKKA